MTAQYSALYGLLDGVIVTHGDNIVFINEVMENLLGASQSVVCKQTLAQRFGADSPLIPLVDYVYADGHRVLNQTIPLNVLSGLGAGQTKEVVMNMIPLSRDNSPSAMILVDRHSFTGDNTAIKDDKTQSLTHVVGMVAHEIKNPLAGIRGAAQLLADGASIDGNAHGNSDDPMLSLIVRETDRIARLIERLEVLDDVPDGAWEYCNVHEILSDVIASARAGFAAHIEIIEDYDPSLPDIWCNRDQMTQVFMNLIKNATEACPVEACPLGQGRVTIKTYYNHRNRGAQGGIPITIDIMDNGDGVPDAIAKKVFDPFVKDKQDGTGLGLAVVSKFVTNHNGQVDFNNTDDGAIFMVKLPHVKEK